MCSECEKYPCAYQAIDRCDKSGARTIAVHGQPLTLCEEHIEFAQMMSRTAQYN